MFNDPTLGFNWRTCILVEGPLVFKQIKTFCEDFSELTGKTADRQEKTQAEAAKSKKPSKSSHSAASATTQH